MFLTVLLWYIKVSSLGPSFSPSKLAEASSYTISTCTLPPVSARELSYRKTVPLCLLATYEPDYTASSLPSSGGAYADAPTGVAAASTG